MTILSRSLKAWMLSYNRGGSEGTVLGNPGPTWWARKGVREPMVILVELDTGTLGDTGEASYTPLWRSQENNMAALPGEDPMRSFSCQMMGGCGVDDFSCLLKLFGP